MTAQTTVDALVWGPAFLDLIFVGIGSGPRPGEEVWAEGMASSPGGVATTAVAAARLGLTTSLATVFGDDADGRAIRSSLEAEGIDLAPSTVTAGEQTPVTVSLAYAGERALITNGRLGRELALLTEAPGARLAVVPIDPGAQLPAAAALAANGTRLLACAAWDSSGRWELGALPALQLLDTLVVNAEEARRLTGCDTQDAATTVLLERVPRVVVTDGARGASAATATQRVRVDGIRVDATDPTGAGDVLLAGLLLGLAEGLPLETTLRLGVAASAFSVLRLGGAVGAPSRQELRGWLAARAEPQWRALAEQLPGEGGGHAGGSDFSEPAHRSPRTSAETATSS